MFKLIKPPQSWSEVKEMGYWRITNQFFLLFFIGAWIYWLTRYGLLVGIIIGWLPAALVAAVLAPLWPVSVIGVVIWLILLAIS